MKRKKYGLRKVPEMVDLEHGQPLRQTAQPPQRESTGSMNLLFCINRKFITLFVSCIRSIVRSGGYAHYDAYVLHSDFDQRGIDALGQDFRGQVDFHFIRVPETLFEGFPESDRYPKQIYYRLAAPLLLPKDLDRILYLDVDTVIINPLTELYETDFAGNFYVGCTHTREFLTKINQARLKSEKAVSYINTGVLLLNLPALRENVSLAEIRAYTQERKHALLLPDQDILTALYGDKVKLADTMRYNLSDRILAFYNADRSHEKADLAWVRAHSVVIHYCGKNKPWHDDYIGVLGVFYQEIIQAPAGSGGKRCEQPSNQETP